MMIPLRKILTERIKLKILREQISLLTNEKRCVAKNYTPFILFLTDGAIFFEFEHSFLNKQFRRYLKFFSQTLGVSFADSAFAVDYFRHDAF